MQNGARLTDNAAGNLDDFPNYQIGIHRGVLYMWHTHSLNLVSYTAKADMPLKKEIREVEGCSKSSKLSSNVYTVLISDPVRNH